MVPGRNGLVLGTVWIDGRARALAELVRGWMEITTAGDAGYYQVGRRGISAIVRVRCLEASARERHGAWGGRVELEEQGVVKVRDSPAAKRQLTKWTSAPRDGHYLILV